MIAYMCGFWACKALFARLFPEVNVGWLGLEVSKEDKTTQSILASKVSTEPMTKASTEPTIELTAEPMAKDIIEPTVS